MAGPVPATHVLTPRKFKGVDGRDKPGHDDVDRSRTSQAGITRPSRESPEMPRYKLLIEYDGTPFVGWQVQDNGASVQGVLTAAVTAFCGESVHVHGAGR